MDRLALVLSAAGHISRWKIWILVASWGRYGIYLVAGARCIQFYLWRGKDMIYKTSIEVLIYIYYRMGRA
jgi:hypothetical protein